jgi:heme-degrading monooxygenase HmoA
MITLIADHWVKPDFMDGAMKAFEDNTDKGTHVHRLVLRSQDDPSKITTVTTWETQEEYQKFMDRLKEIYAKQDPDAPKAMNGERLEGFEVLISKSS